ncbi:MAG: lipocalin family protein [Polaromonas sp.]|jgi:apolipoprotein D and lipocalin family protein
MNKLFVGLLLSLSAFHVLAQEALTTVASVDVPRYMGTWYEIAKYPNWFQRKCVSNTSAHYSTQSDGTVRVQNRCTQEDGKVSQAIGQARQIGQSTSPKLQVRFAPEWLSFLPFVWGNYWVIDLDTDYQLVAVSEPKREYLWVLSRTPEVPAKAYDELLARLEKKGFDLKKLEKSRQIKP